MIVKLWAATFGKIQARDAFEASGFAVIAVAAWELHYVAGIAAAGVALIIMATFGGRR
jgi:hypothetical protein